jgi:hypothetical protein
MPLREVIAEHLYPGLWVSCLDVCQLAVANPVGKLAGDPLSEPSIDTFLVDYAQSVP